MNIDDLGLVIDRNDQPVLVSANIEDSQILVHIRASKRRAKLGKILPLCRLDRRQPMSKWGLGIWVICPELSKRLL
jgi:hypothetical protein